MGDSMIYVKCSIAAIVFEVRGGFVSPLVVNICIAVYFCRGDREHAAEPTAEPAPATKRPPAEGAACQGIGARDCSPGCPASVLLAQYGQYGTFPRVTWGYPCDPHHS